MKAQSGLHFSWGLVISIIVSVVILAIVFVFVYPKITATGFGDSASGVGNWLVSAFSIK